MNSKIIIVFFRTIFENHFSQFSEKEQVYNFVSPKVRRLIEILLQYKPSKRVAPEQPENDTNKAQVNDSESKNSEDAESTYETNTAKGAENNSESAEPTAPLTICDSYIRYKNDKANRWKNKRKFQNKQQNVHKPKASVDESEIVCGVIFVKSRLIATVIHYLLSVSTFFRFFRLDEKNDNSSLF